MATSQAVESFWLQLTKSRLLTPQEVKAVADELAGEGVDTDALAAKKLVQRGLITRYQADRLLEGRSRGFFFDDYKLLDLLGIGGMGWVYRAQSVSTGQTFALKVLLDQLKQDRGLLARFEQEVRAGQRFKHENIVRTYESGNAGGLPYMIMEFVEGPSLLELLRMRERSRLPWQQACDIARQAANGLHHVHRAGFVHRDIKPQNLLVDHNGLTKILDFGLSMKKDGEDGDEFSMAMIFGHECVGTAAYTSPEQALDSLTADARSDIYSLGCTLFASLTGDTPFPYSRTSEVLKGHQSVIPRHVSDMVPAIPREVGDLVAKMLAKNPADRFASAAEVAHALAPFSKTLPVEFNFSRILAERNRGAEEKLAELQKRQRSASGAASSTAKLTAGSSVASSTTAALPQEANPSAPAGPSVIRRGGFRFEKPPSITMKQKIESVAHSDASSMKAINSGMVLQPFTGGAAIPLVKDPFVIGRRGDCDLQIQDNAVSGRHCELRFDGTAWTLIDLNSRNGTRVNGALIQEHRLKLGDKIIVGPSLALRYTHPAKESAARWATRVRVGLLVVLGLAGLAGLVAAGLWMWGGRG
ncbi:protein kinase domain-containing protein [Schlesneria sp.]|uniref:protein kinase domain-containing protein n=1 Tax=Schlesneria sp. TaxID=2762018 RepID=UPI002F0145FC